jgi:toxin-antitoxin system PIN domain toxin
VILVDANLLIYAHTDASKDHEAAREWLDAQLNGTAPVGLPWPSLLAFLRVMTNPRIVLHYEPMADAWAQVQTWLGCENVWIPQPTDRHAEILGQMVRGSGVSANLVPDAHLAALALEHGLTLCSADGDFARFPGLRWLNPLAPR